MHPYKALNVLSLTVVLTAFTFASIPGHAAPIDQPVQVASKNMRSDKNAGLRSDKKSNLRRDNVKKMRNDKKGR